MLSYEVIASSKIKYDTTKCEHTAFSNDCYLLKWSCLSSLHLMLYVRSPGRRKKKGKAVANSKTIACFRIDPYLAHSQRAVWTRYNAHAQHSINKMSTYIITGRKSDELLAHILN